MKKLKHVLGIALLVSLLVAIFPNFASANQVSLLSGKTIQVGSSHYNYLSTTTTVTDNNLATGISLAAAVDNSNIKDSMAYDFSSNQTIDSFKIIIDGYTNQSFMIFFWGTDNTNHLAAYNISTMTNNNGVYELPQRVTGVKKVSLWNTHTGTQTVLEWDVYRDAAPISPVLSASAGDELVALNWNSTDARSYTIKRSTTAGGPYDVIADNVTTTNYNDTNVTNGVTYYYVIFAKNNEGQSVDSNEANATPQGNVNPEPTGRALLTIYISGGQIKEYDLSAAELSAFLNWYDAKDAGSGPAKYAFTKTWNIGPFKTRTEYVIFDKILTFDVDEYEVENP